MKKYLASIIGLCCLLGFGFASADDKSSRSCERITINGERIKDECRFSDGQILTNWQEDIFDLVRNLSPVMVILFSIGIFIFIIYKIRGICKMISSGGKNISREGCQEKALTIHYTPPKDIEMADIFWFRYGDKNTRIFSSLIYYRVTKGWIEIKYKVILKDVSEPIGTYYLKETAKAPIGASLLDKELFEIFFGPYNEALNEIQLDNELFEVLLYDYHFKYNEKDNNIAQKESKIGININKMFALLKERSKHNGLIKVKKSGDVERKLTPTGESVFANLNGYKEYLEKVEIPVIKKEVKEDSEYINKILPWISLFGLEKKVFPFIMVLKGEDIVRAIPGFILMNKVVEQDK